MNTVQCSWSIPQVPSCGFPMECKLYIDHWQLVAVCSKNIWFSDYLNKLWICLCNNGVSRVCVCVILTPAFSLYYYWGYSCTKWAVNCYCIKDMMFSSCHRFFQACWWLFDFLHRVMHSFMYMFIAIVVSRNLLCSFVSFAVVSIKKQCKSKMWMFLKQCDF